MPDQEIERPVAVFEYSEMPLEQLKTVFIGSFHELINRGVNLQSQPNQELETMSNLKDEKGQWDSKTIRNIVYMLAAFYAPQLLPVVDVATNILTTGQPGEIPPETAEFLSKSVVNIMAGFFGYNAYKGRVDASAKIS